MTRFARVLAPIVVASLGAIALGQTPPIKPNTPDVVVPAPVVVPPPATLDPMVGSKPLTVAEAVSIALSRQANLAVARASVQAAQGQTRQTRSGLKPQVTVTGTATDTSSFRSPKSGNSSGSTTSTGINTNGTATLSQLLYDFGRTRDQVRQQEALLRASRQVLNKVQLDTVQATKQNFYAYAAAIRFVQIAESNVANRQSQLDLANAELLSGLGAPSDYVRAKTALADAVLSLTAARASASTTQLALAQQMGIDPRTPITPADSTEAAPDTSNLNGLVDKAMRLRPEIIEQRERIAAAKAGVSAARKGNSPALSITANLTGKGSDPFETQNGALGLSLSFPLWDSGLTTGRIQTAQSGQTTAEAQLTLAVQQVVTDVSQAFISLGTAEQNLATAKVQVANAAELLRISEGRYRGGVGTFLEVSDAQSSLFTSQKNVVQAESDLQRARVALARAVGQMP